LFARGDVDDGEPPMAQEHMRRLVKVEAFAIRPAMGERARHPLDVAPIARPGKSRDAAHAP
jgi:hypothetical protein